MKLLQLRVENYRGLKLLELDVDDITVLIGENNTGKSSVLDALQSCLSSARARRGDAFDPYDFHLASPTAEPMESPEISLTLTFGERAKDEWPDALANAFTRAKVLQVLPESELRQVILRVRAGFDPATGVPRPDSVFLDFAGNPLPSSGAAFIALNEAIAFHYLSALRDAAKHFDPKGLFWRFFVRNSSVSPEDRAALEASLREVNDRVVASHKTFEIAKAKLEKLQDVVPLAAGTAVSIDALPARISDMLSHTQVSLGPADGSRIPLGRHGEGTQSLAVVMLFHAFLEASNAGSPFLALEEPEAHLHPSAIRSLWGLLADLPGQKIVTTHSGDLVSEVPLASIRRLARGADGIKAHRIDASKLEPHQLRQFEFHVRHSRGELLLARCWLLVEGETEMTILPTIARRLGTPLERFGIRCVPYRHEADIAVYLLIAKQLGVRWCLLCDSDSQGTTDRKKAEAALAGLPAKEVIFGMPGSDIEEYLASAGFIDVYEPRISDQKKATVTAKRGDADYVRQVLNAMPNKSSSKTSAAVEIASRIANGTAIPPILQQVVEAAVRLGRAG
jgi:putative ATP-dependent endonuclease of OLD family